MLTHPGTHTHSQLFKLCRSPFTTTHTPFLSHLYHPCADISAPLQPTTAPCVNWPPSLSSAAYERGGKESPGILSASPLAHGTGCRVAFIPKSPCSIPIINDYTSLTTIRIDRNQGLKARRDRAWGREV